MKNTRLTEIWVGIFTVAGIAALFMLSLRVSNFSSYSEDPGFTVQAYFSDVSGLKVRSPVTMSGVTIGRVAEISFDKDRLEAYVVLRIDSEFDKIPNGTSANIYTAGLLGEKYVGLLAGSASDPCEDEKLEAELEGRDPELNGLVCGKGYLEQGFVITQTQGALVLEKLIAKFVDSVSDKDDKK